MMALEQAVTVAMHTEAMTTAHLILAAQQKQNKLNELLEPMPS